jgi:Cdc6-like AAA superfamily ATPase
MFGFGVSIICYQCTANRIKVRLNIEQIEPVIWNKIAFERLVLEQKSKELIKALVTVHVSAKKMGDIISGKGNGLIILLHGSPGVGKTLTAGNLSSKVQIFSSKSNATRREVRFTKTSKSTSLRLSSKIKNYMVTRRFLNIAG